MFDNKAKAKFELIIAVSVPFRFQRMMTSFSETTNKGRVIWRLSIISIILPHIRTKDHNRGMTERKVITIKMLATRRSDTKLFWAGPSDFGHKPVSSKPKRFSSIAHTKSEITKYVNVKRSRVCRRSAIYQYYFNVIIQSHFLQR